MFESLEIVILAIVIIGQLLLSVHCYNLIKNLKSTFDQLLKVASYKINKGLMSLDNAMEHIEAYEEGDKLQRGELVVPLVDSHSKHKVTDRIHDTINRYLLNNFGAPVNFSIIKDMVDREIEVKDDEISQLISTPLYLGLAATMFGIIVGLWSMPDIETNEFTESINALIGGVKWAMGASLCGLMCTTVLSSYTYKAAKNHLLNTKNDQLSYLQHKLLPALIKAEDTGLAGIKQSMDKFSRSSTQLTENLRTVTDRVSAIFDSQLKVVEEVKSMEAEKVSMNNLEMFSQLDKNMASLVQMGEYLGQMERITQHLSLFAHKTQQIDAIATEIKDNVKETNKLNHESRMLAKFLTNHFEQLEDHGSKVKIAVDLTESHFAKAIETLKEKMGEELGVYRKTADTHELTMQNIYHEIATKIQQTANNQIIEYEQIFQKYAPQLHQLEKLDLLQQLPEINKTIAENSEFIKHGVTIQERAETKTGQLASSAEKILSKMDQGQIVAKLSDLDRTLSKQHKAKSKAASAKKNLSTEPEPLPRKSAWKRLGISLRNTRVTLFKKKKPSRDKAMPEHDAKIDPESTRDEKD